VKLIGKIVIAGSPKSNHYFTLGGHLAIISRDVNTGAGEEECHGPKVFHYSNTP